MNLSSFSFYEFCILEEQELWRIAYMKDEVLYEVVPTKFDSYFSDLYFIFYEFSNFMNEQVYKNTTVTPLRSMQWVVAHRSGKQGGNRQVATVAGGRSSGNGQRCHRLNQQTKSGLG
jgi:hypothetical protein